MLTLQACALFQFQDKNTDEYLSKRAEQRWQALIEGDFEQAYEYEAPGYRKAKSFEYFRNQFGGWVRWKSAETISVAKTEQEMVATVSVRVLQDVFSVKGEVLSDTYSYHDEKWLNVDGEWWHYTK